MFYGLFSGTEQSWKIIHYKVTKRLTIALCVFIMLQVTLKALCRNHFDIEIVPLLYWKKKSVFYLIYVDIIIIIFKIVNIIMSWHEKKINLIFFCREVCYAISSYLTWTKIAFGSGGTITIFNK